jgi:Membrane domain of glycerophosphoryl diester phosphodiesterase
MRLSWPVVATTPGLRPLGLGEILDVGIKLYLRHWRTLMACVVWVVLPVQIVSVLVTLSIAPEQLDFTSTETVDPGDEDAFFASQAIIALLSGLVYMLSTAACFKAVADGYLGSEPGARRSLGFAVRRLPGLIWFGIVLTVALMLAFIALIIPGIWLSVAWSLAIPVLLFERVGAFGALRRSFRLVRGRWWKICLTLLVGVLLVSFLGGILQGVLLVVPSLLSDGNDAVNAFSAVVAGTIGSVITTPFTAAIVTLLYFDQRVRKEGFDLQLLAEGLGTERDPDAPLPSAPPLVDEPYTPEQRAQAPYWPPPPGWTPPEPSPPAPGGWAPPSPAGPERPQPAAPSGDALPGDAPPGDAPPRDAPPAEGAPPAEAPPPPADAPGDESQRGWQPPKAPSWPPESPPRGPGGL